MVPRDTAVVTAALPVMVAGSDRRIRVGVKQDPLLCSDSRAMIGHPIREAASSGRHRILA
jgi:hypothetical protein